MPSTIWPNHRLLNAEYYACLGVNGLVVWAIGVLDKATYDLLFTELLTVENWVKFITLALPYAQPE